MNNTLYTITDHLWYSNLSSLHLWLTWMVRSGTGQSSITKKTDLKHRFMKIKQQCSTSAHLGTVLIMYIFGNDI